MGKFVFRCAGQDGKPEVNFEGCPTIPQIAEHVVELVEVERQLKEDAELRKIKSREREDEPQQYPPGVDTELSQEEKEKAIRSGGLLKAGMGALARIEKTKERGLPHGGKRKRKEKKRRWRESPMSSSGEALILAAAILSQVTRKEEYESFEATLKERIEEFCPPWTNRLLVRGLIKFALAVRRMP